MHAFKPFSVCGFAGAVFAGAGAGAGAGIGTGASRRRICTSSDNVFHGSWSYNSRRALKYPSGCVVDDRWNCLAMRKKLKFTAPELSWQNWWWQPAECDLEPFDASVFASFTLKRPITFVGDSVVRQMYVAAGDCMPARVAPVGGCPRRQTPGQSAV